LTAAAHPPPEREHRRRGRVPRKPLTDPRGGFGSERGLSKAVRRASLGLGEAMMWAGTFRGTSARAVGDMARGKFARLGSQAETRLVRGLPQTRDVAMRNYTEARTIARGLARINAARS